MGAVGDSAHRDGRLKWLVLALAAIAISGNYYAFDALAPVADMLRTQRGLSQSQIGLLNAMIGLPNIPLSLVGGLLIDRFGASRAAVLFAGFCFVGAVLTAIGEPFGLMVFGRLLFGIGQETLLIALLAGIAIWFHAARAALAMSLLFSLARVGSYMADISPNWAPGVYAGGWQPPLALAAGLTGISLIGALAYWALDVRRGPPVAGGTHSWSGMFAFGGFDRSFWYILILNVLFASVFFPFRSTFAIVYFQDAKGLTLAAAGLVNSWVFFTAIFATPIFGMIADRFGRRAMLLTIGAGLMPLTFLTLGATHWSLWISTAMMGLAFSVVPAVIWPATAMLVAPKRLGTAYGIINVLQSLGLAVCNLAAGWLNDVYQAGPAHPAGYTPMLWMFGVLATVSFAATAALWARESGPHGHGLNKAIAVE
ncbi:MFS transporter [Sphingomonas sp. MMS24-J13]|uniref:MFS transporter n=1 Tax=Sphingomonas sp. MMS24-J13 TaxID=3238686 RepID=UPI00384D1E2B